jgi:hypothetical protein
MKVMPALESVPPPVKKDPRQAALDYAAEHIDDTIEKLKQLCKYRPDETDAAADKVYFNSLNMCLVQSVEVVHAVLQVVCTRNVTGSERCY